MTDLRLPGLTTEWEEAWAEGHDQGHSDGWQQGYEAGLEDDERSMEARILIDEIIADLISNGGKRIYMEYRDKLAMSDFAKVARGGNQIDELDRIMLWDILAKIANLLGGRPNGTEQPRPIKEQRMKIDFLDAHFFAQTTTRPNNKFMVIQP